VDEGEVGSWPEVEFGKSDADKFGTEISVDWTIE
jgi:hypothetical protein